MSEQRLREASPGHTGWQKDVVPERSGCGGSRDRCERSSRDEVGQISQKYPVRRLLIRQEPWNCRLLRRCQLTAHRNVRTEAGIVLKTFSIRNFSFRDFGVSNVDLAIQDPRILTMLHPLHALPVIFVFCLANTADLVVAPVGRPLRPDKLMRTLVEDWQLKDSSSHTSVFVV